LAKRRNLKKEKAARNAAYARQFQKRTPKYKSGYKNYSEQNKSETKEQETKE
jgi:hypothetical protein